MILDFGLALREAEAAATMTLEGQVLGTPAYMSPEQAAGHGHSADGRSDVWSLGVILYELLTGELPFRGSKHAILLQIRNDEPRPPRRVNDKIPRDLETIALKCLAKSPARRYATARALSDDLRRWLRGEPILARPVGSVEKLWLWSRRNPRVAGLAGAVAMLLVAVAVVSSIMAFRESRHRQFAEQAARTERDLRTAADQANTQLAQANTDLEAANASERAAKHDADQKRIDAEKARDETKQVLDYLVASFRKPDPAADGEKLTVAELFDQAVEQLETTFPNQPLIQARLLNAIGQTYYGLGLYQKAVAVHERARVLRRSELGETHEDTLRSMSNLALAYTTAGRLTDALSLYERALDLLKAKLGTEHPDTLMSMNNLAFAYRSAGRLAEALPLYEQTLELRKVKLGPEHPDTLVSVNNLAAAYESTGRLAEALSLYEQTLEVSKAKLGPEHPNTLSLMNNLGQAYLMDEQPEKAMPVFDRFLAAHRARATPDNPTFAGRLAAVSLESLKHHQYPAAETYLRECLMIREKKLPDDWMLFNTKSMLGGALAGQKKFQEAEPLLVEGYSGMKEREANIPPAAKTRLPEAIRRLVDLYETWGKPQEAAQWREKLKAQLPPDEPPRDDRIRPDKESTDSKQC